MSINEENCFQHLCCSEDRKILQDMIDEFESQTRNDEGANYYRDKMPETISFGRFSLRKKIEHMTIVKYCCSEFNICPDYELLYIYEVKPA